MMSFVKMQTVDMSWYRILRPSTWRATFLAAAANAASRVSKYSWNRGDYENAARWKSREGFIKEYAKRIHTKHEK
jgi:hypothetical protein